MCVRAIIIHSLVQYNTTTVVFEEGSQFTIQTDHRPLVTALTKSGCHHNAYDTNI